MENEGKGPSSSRRREPVRVHEPVLLQETLDILGLEPGMTVVDGTVGALGHASAIARAISPDGCLLGLDRDAEILARAQESLPREVGGLWERVRVRLLHSSFTRIEKALHESGLEQCDRVLLDLGVSSLHLDSPERGFSFMHDAPLDMRMDTSSRLTAERWLQKVSERELVQVLREYGEERFARRIARSILERRRAGAMSRTSHLADAVWYAVPGPARHRRTHPATRTFQAVRIVVNDELGELERGLDAALHCLRDDGRLAVISFHSLEDRIVKRFIRERMTPLVRRPITASEAEVRRNPRARSAKLRCGRKLAEVA